VVTALRDLRHAERIRDELGRTGADALWVHPSVNFAYLTGLRPLALERPTALVILAGGGLRVLAPLMLAPELEQLDGADVCSWTDADGPEAAIRRVLDGVGRCVVDPSLPVGTAFGLQAARPGLELELDRGIVAALRRRKQPDEVEQLRAAGREADAAVEWIAGHELAGRSELELSLDLQARFLSRGVQPYGGYVVATGANAALPHHETGDTPIAPDAPLLADLGCTVSGYHSDITRVFFPGAPAGEVVDAYEAICAAHDAVIAGLEPGLPCDEADRLARDVIETAGYGERFVHRTGHGVGLEIHEEPYLRAGNPERLEPGNVFSVEPGIYVPGRFGLRYENLVHLGPDGPELLNASPRLHTLGT
jgi:Xaa-Pro aminopeptidase